MGYSQCAQKEDAHDGKLLPPWKLQGQNHRDREQQDDKVQDHIRVCTGVVELERVDAILVVEEFNQRRDGIALEQAAKEE